MNKPAATVAEPTAPTAKIIRIAQTKPASRKPAWRGSSKPMSDKERKNRIPQCKARAETEQKTRNRAFSSSFTLQIDAI
jgi:hypothetical protein